MTRTTASGLRAVAAVMVLIAIFPVLASAQWTGSGGAYVDAFSCGSGRWENDVYQQDFYLKTTVQPTGDPRYNAMLTPITVNGAFYYTTLNPYVQSTFDGTVTLSYSAGTGFGYGSPAPGTTVRYYISGSVIDSTTGGAVSGVSFREVRCVVAAPPQPTPTPAPTNTPQPTPTNTPVPTPTNTPEPTPTNTPVPTPTNTPEPTPTNTPVPTPTNTPEPTPTNTPVPTPTNTPEPTPTNTPEPTPTNTPEPTPTNTPEPTPTNTLEPTPTNTPEPTATTEPSPTATSEPPTPTATTEPSPTATTEPSPTATSEPGVTPSPTVEVTATATVVPTSTTEPAVTPTGTTVETPTSPPDLHTITVRIVTPNGESIEGAPWDLYAQSASQAAVQPYLSGLVGPNNTIELVNLPRGEYRLVVRPAGMAPFEVMVTSVGQSTEIVVHLPDAPPATGTPAQPTGAATQPATSAATSTATAGPTVAAFPNTGAGDANMMPMTVLISAACIVTIMFSAFVLRRSDS